MFELLVTIAVLSILASMSTSVFYEYKMRVYDLDALANLRNMVTSLNVGFADHGSPYGHAQALGITGNYGIDKHKNSDWSDPDMARRLMPGLSMTNPEIAASLIINSFGPNGSTRFFMSTIHCKTLDLIIYSRGGGYSSDYVFTWSYDTVVNKIQKGYGTPFDYHCN